MNVLHLAAFSDHGDGGNPAGVVLLDTAVPEEEMRRVAAEVGYSETAFAVPVEGVDRRWRVRYFSPASEVPFCGHATIALGAALGQTDGAGIYTLDLNEATITVEADGDGAGASLKSPPTRSRAATDDEVADVLALFDLPLGALDPQLPPARIHAGADHIMLALRERSCLAGMHYDLELGREIMQRHGLVTIMLVHVTGPQEFAVRNAFASGGVLEDPATGAAAAAFAGYLRDCNWPHGRAFTILQGEDMGCPSRIGVELTERPGSPISISGEVRRLDM